MKDKHEPNEVGYGVGNTGKAGSVNLHPGAPKREVATGKMSGGDDTSVSFSSSETPREKDNEVMVRKSTGETGFAGK